MDSLLSSRSHDQVHPSASPTSPSPRALPTSAFSSAYASASSSRRSSLCDSADPYVLNFATCTTYASSSSASLGLQSATDREGARGDPGLLSGDPGLLSLSIPIVYVSLSGQFLACNDPFAQLTGLTSMTDRHCRHHDQLTQHSIFSVTHRDYVKTTRLLFQHFLQELTSRAELEPLHAQADLELQQQPPPAHSFSNSPKSLTWDFESVWIRRLPPSSSHAHSIGSPSNSSECVAGDRDMYMSDTASSSGPTSPTATFSSPPAPLQLPTVQPYASQLQQLQPQLLTYAFPTVQPSQQLQPQLLTYALSRPSSHVHTGTNIGSPPGGQGRTGGHAYAYEASGSALPVHVTVCVGYGADIDHMHNHDHPMHDHDHPMHDRDHDQRTCDEPVCIPPLCIPAAVHVGGARGGGSGTRGCMRTRRISSCNNTPRVSFDTSTTATTTTTTTTTSLRLSTVAGTASAPSSPRGHAVSVSVSAPAAAVVRLRSNSSVYAFAQPIATRPPPSSSSQQFFVIFAVPRTPNLANSLVAVSADSSCTYASGVAR